MIDVIISINDTNTPQDLINTLYSLKLEENLKIIIIASGKNIDRIISEETKNLFPDFEDIILMKNEMNTEHHSHNFFTAFHGFNTFSNIITFLKAGDLFTGIHLCPIIEKEFKENPKLLTLHTKVENENNLNLYINEKVNLQGWFFNRNFLDYYNFLNQFKNEIEMALHLSYITNLQPMFHKELNRTGICIKNSLSDIGTAFLNYFNIILPKQVFFNVELGTEYLYDLICDCYISYVQAINLELLDNNSTNSLIDDIGTFYEYFKELELDDLEKLLNIYNNKMKIIYNSLDDAFLRKIPDITFIAFLENFEKRV